MSLLLRSLLGVILLFAAGAASAQNDTRALQDRLQRLERDLQSLQSQVASGAGARPGGPVGAPGGDGSIASTLLSRISQIEQDQRILTGQVEEVGFAVGQLKQRLDRMVTDMEFRLSELEKKQSEQGAANVGAAPVARPGAPAVAGAAPGGPTLGAPPRNLGSISAADERAIAERAAAQGGQTANVAAPPPGRVAPSAAAPASVIRLPPGTPRDQYDYAFDLLKQGKYADAEQAMRQFVQAYPQDPLSGNAQYWLGETFYVRNNHTEAAVQFMQGYQRYPQSPKAPDNLFKLGMSLAILDRKPEACAAFGRFNTEYPGAPGALKQRVQEERRRLACG
jgi:tol-pal system protein YbgF